MAQKSRVSMAPSAPLSQRIDRARQEGRLQQALELTHQFYKNDPTEESLALLRQVSFERGEQQLAQGHRQDAALTLQNIIEMAGAPEFQRALAQKLAQCGAFVAALALADRLGDSQVRGEVLCFVADHAIVQRSSSLLPADLQPQFDAIITAFAQAEVGKDNEARTTLQAIGLTSPFMEWRILLRGLLAYYANDDVRALENWQRLSPQRLPARLAYPLRLGIDQTFRAAQPPAMQNVLRQQLDRLQGAGALPALRVIQAQLAQKGKMAQAFRQIENLLPGLRQQAADLLPRLAACCRWSVIENGQEEDLGRYSRVFGPPADDLHLYRMTALAMEKNGFFEEAHQKWQLFEKEITETNPAWPGAQGRQVRALIWAHIANLAVENETDEMQVELLPFLPRPPKKKKNFTPSSEECFRKSLALAPESLSTHQALVQYLLTRPDKGPAIEAGKKLLEHFPDHVATLQILGTLCMGEWQLEEASDYLQRALKVNPLEQSLRHQLVVLHQMRARAFSCGKRFDEARAAILASLSLYDLPIKFPLLCVRAILELKAKDRPTYEKLVAEAEQEAGRRITVVFSLMCESIRQKLPPAEKKLFTQEFKTALAGNVDPGAIQSLIAMLMNQRICGPPFAGQKGHEKSILALADKAPLQDYSEAALESLCDVLGGLGAAKVLKRFVSHARNLFPDNPDFMLLEANSMLQGLRPNSYRAAMLLEKARSFIQALPRGDRQQNLLERLQGLEEKLRDDGGFGSFMRSMMGQMFGEDED